MERKTLFEDKYIGYHTFGLGTNSLIEEASSGEDSSNNPHNNNVDNNIDNPGGNISGKEPGGKENPGDTIDK